MEMFDSHPRLVFADKKPMREVDTFGRARRDPINGDIDIPHHSTDNANSRKLFNIVAAVTVKQNIATPIEAVVLDIIGDSIVFQHFVIRLLEIGFLAPGGVFIVDNCTIHLKGTNEFIIDALWNHHNILLVPLPPYTPELNPT